MSNSKARTTEYYIKFGTIYNASASRQEAHRAISEGLDSELTYKQFMGRVKYLKNVKGLPLKDLSPAAIDWTAVSAALE